MEFLEFAKSKWNLVLGVSLAIVVVITGFISPPVFSEDMSISGNNLAGLSKFIVAGLILLLLVPCSIFNKNQHRWYWWSGALLLFGLAFFSFFRYNQLLAEKTAYHEYEERFVVVGNQLLPIAQQSVDSAQKIHRVKLSTADMLASLGPRDSIWPVSEIHQNAALLVQNYLVTVSLFALFVLFGIQASYCSSEGRK